MKMKFTKMTHLSIIVVLAIMFIVVYLYYTISDVKKMHNEVSKLSQDIEKMNQSIVNITGTIMPLLTTGPSTYPFQDATPSVLVCAASPSPQQHTDIDAGIDSVSSVASQELNTIMETIDDEQDEENDVQPLLTKSIDITQIPTISAPVQATETHDVVSLDEIVAPALQNSTDLSTLSLDDLKKVSYEDIRKYCKAQNISHKGSKDVLIYRIKGVTA